MCSRRMLIQSGVGENIVWCLTVSTLLFFLIPFKLKKLSGFLLSSPQYFVRNFYRC